MCPHSEPFHSGPDLILIRQTRTDLVSLVTGRQGMLTTITGQFSYKTGRHRPTCNEQPLCLRMVGPTHPKHLPGS